MIVERLVPSIRYLAWWSFFCLFLAAEGAAQVSSRPAVGTYDVVALRVEFQPDTSRFTTGSGRFEGDLYGGLEPAVDPLPHDAAYFQAHLDFLRDYVERVSDGTVEIRTHLIPEVVEVPKTMGAYAPTGPDADDDAELARLAGLVEDAWRAADRQVTFETGALVPQKTAFVLFHAGVGRDIELIGTTLEKTPQDLPSLFFDKDALDRLGVGDLTFNGFSIDHSLIIPRTETRLGTDFIADEPFLLELSINGLLAASFFNFLGVPDLFDTRTGESAIGPFGLMDTQGIFAYRGLFPPEPMAWTKYYLGWTEPVELEGNGPEMLSLAAASLPGRSESARALISEAEYFLIENRFRDPEQDGLTLRVWKDGAITEQHFENGDEEFNSFTIDGFTGGVVVGADNYDWALPGGLDEDENPLNGGMLIWHVDERRLRDGLPRNAVNVGTENRAIDLEEADGAQDIGFSSGPFGPQVELGTPFDFFFQGNPVRVLTEGGREIRLYENRFGPDTHPNSSTNGGGPSFVVLEAFSEPAAEMSFTYRLVAQEGLAPVMLEESNAFRHVVDSLGILFDARSGMIGSGQHPLAYSDPGRRTLSLSSVASFASAALPVVSEGRLVSLVAPADEPVTLQGTPLTSESGEPDWRVSFPAASGLMEVVSPIVGARSDRYYAIIEGPDGRTLMEATSSSGQLRSITEFGSLVGISSADGEAAGELLVAGREGAGFLDGDRLWSYSVGPETEVGRPVFGRDAGGLVGVVPLIEEGVLLVLGANGEVTSIDVVAAAGVEGGASHELSPYPVLVDLDGDGRLDVLAAYATRLLAFSQSGAVVRDFPKRIPAEISGQPLVARLEGEDYWTIFSAARNGYLYAHDAAGLRQGFPLEIGRSAEATPLLSGGRIYAISHEGNVKVWSLPPLEEIWWGEIGADADNSSFVRLDASAPPPGSRDALIVESETYNWPNPIESGSTYLRIGTARDAHARVKIIDAGGGLVEEVDLGQVRAGIPTEVEWRADVQSGLYFARFTATQDDGTEDTKVVKMAVIR